MNPESRSNYCEIPGLVLRTIPEMTALEHLMQFDTKIAVVIRSDLEAWQKLNVASFLAGGIAAAFPECIGEPYEDGSGTKYLSLIGQPILIYGADRAALTRALERALARNVKPALYTEDMFRTTHDARQPGSGEGRDPRRAQSGGPRDARRTQGDRQDRRRFEVSQLAVGSVWWTRAMAVL